jgi:hypothetical protein
VAGARAGPGSVITAPHDRLKKPQPRPHVCPPYYKLLPVTLSFNSPDPLPLSPLSRLLRFSSRRRREVFSSASKRSDRLREAFSARRDSERRITPLYCAAFPSPSSFSSRGGGVWGGETRGGCDCGEAGETPAPFPTAFTKHIARRYAARPLAPFIFSVRVFLCGCVIIFVSADFCFSRARGGEMRA